jgi:muramoyltetrapeptide carboxypeptidase LdcA involved in peptidoglycan recycling
MKKPARLKKGDNIAIVSPSWGGPSVFPHIYELGLKNLEVLGLNPIAFPTACMDADRLYRNPELRAEDINRAFADPTIQGIIATIGGDDAVRILKHLDIEKIKTCPKLIMGYSDFTPLNTYLNQNGLVTFNGPAVMAGFAQFKNFSPAYQRYIEDYLFAEAAPFDAPFDLPVFSSYTEGYAPWEDLDNGGRINELHPNDGLHFVQGKTKVSGQLFGGCIEILEMMKGTPFWPQPTFWQRKILFLETSENKPSIELVKYWLRNYGVMGVYEQVSGLLIGRPKDYSAQEKVAFEAMIQRVVRDEFGQAELAIVCNVDFGHTDPQLILPLGIDIEINIQEKKLTQLGSAFAAS